MAEKPLFTETAAVGERASARSRLLLGSMEITFSGGSGFPSTTLDEAWAAQDYRCGTAWDFHPLHCR